MFPEISTGSLNEGDSIFFPSKMFYTNTQLKQKTKIAIEIHCLSIWVSAQKVPPKGAFP